MAVRREPGLLSMDAELALEVLIPICVGITWTWTVPGCELDPFEFSLEVTEVLAGMSDIVGWLICSCSEGGGGEPTHHQR